MCKGCLSWKANSFRNWLAKVDYRMDYRKTTKLEHMYPFQYYSISNMVHACRCFQVKDKEKPPEPYDTATLKRYAFLGYTINPTILYYWQVRSELDYNPVSPYYTKHLVTVCKHCRIQGGPKGPRPHLKPQIVYFAPSP